MLTLAINLTARNDRFCYLFLVPVLHEWGEIAIFIMNLAARGTPSGSYPDNSDITDAMHMPNAESRSVYERINELSTILNFDRFLLSYRFLPC
jgi:hypothetical protein